MLDHDMFEGKLVAARLSDNSELSFGRRHFGAAKSKASAKAANERRQGLAQ
jgi:hypothetical protein